MKALSFLLVTVLFISCSTESLKEVKSPEIKLETISKHMSFLASDEMMGRNVFTKEIGQVEDYITSEFKRLGLKAFPKYPDFKHTFTLYQYSVNKKASSVSVNGKAIETFIVSSEKSVKLNNSESFEIFSFGKGANPRDLFKKMNESKKNVFIWLDEAHKAYYSRIENYLSRAKTTPEKPSEKITIIALGLKQKITELNATISVDTKEGSATNTIGYIEGTDLKDEYVLFGAHHDHLGIDKSGKDSLDNIFNGANDNATGTSAVMMLAKYYSELKSNKRSLIFSTYTAEEKGLLGSTELAKEFPVELSQLKMMINIEMLGQETDWGKKSVFMTGYERSDMGEIMNASANDTSLIFVHPDPYKRMNLFYRSDNAAFAKQGVLAHTISSTSMKIQPNTYHQLNDDNDHIDFKNMRDLVEGITKLSRTMISGEKTPQFLDKDKK